MAAKLDLRPDETPAKYDPHLASDVSLTLAVNAQGLVMATSPSVVGALGRAPDALIGEHLEALVHPDDRAALLLALSAPDYTASGSLDGSLDGGQQRATCRVRAQDDGWLPCAITAVPMVDGSDHPMTLVTLRPFPSPLPPAAHADVGEVPEGTHAVQFYETDEFLVDALTRFVQTGLAAGETCAVIATRAHRARLETQLRASGLDLTATRRDDVYMALDADTLLRTFLVDGMPDPDRFAQAVGRVIDRATQGGRRLRLFGEMVAQLWQAGNSSAALRLEALWNELQQRTIPAFTLLCAYPIHVFAGNEQQSAFAAVKRQHAQVIPDETYLALASPDDRSRAIARLQQQAHSLQVEIAQRQLAEERLRVAETRYRSLFEASLDGILLIEPDTGRISEANPTAVELLGATREHVVGQKFWQVGLFPGRRAAQEVARGVREQREFRLAGLPLQTQDGQHRFVDFVCNRFWANGHDMIQCHLRDVTQRKQLEHEAAERASELEAIQTVTDAALAHDSLDTLVPELLERVRAVLTVDNVAILLPDDTGRDLRIYLARGPEEEVAGQVQVPIGQGVAGRIASTRQPLIIDDLRLSKAVNPFLRERLRSLMGVPLLVEDRLVGVIHAATIEPHHFTPPELRLLQLVADRIALAIERAQLHQEAQVARREAVERVNQLQATIEAIADGVVVFDGDGRLIQMNLTAQRLLGYDAPPAYATTTTQISRRRVRDAQGQPLPVHEWPVNRVLRGEVITAAQIVDMVIQTAEGRDIQVSVSGAPIRDDAGALRGAVCVFRDVTEQRRLERRTHDALTALLAMAGTLIDLPTEPVAEEPAPLAPASSLVAQHLARLTCDVLGCQRVSISVIAPETQLQLPIAVVGLTPEQESQWWAEQLDHPVRYGEGTDPVLLARFEAGEVLVVDMTEPPFDARPNPYGITTVLAAPLRVGARMIGTLALDFGGPPHIFTEQEQALAAAVAQLVALVIERDRLLREREVAQANELAAQVTTRRMNTFLGIAGHELRTPVTSIKAGVQLTERALRVVLETALPAETARPLQRAQALLLRAEQQANRLNRLIEDVLDVTRTQAGKLELRVEPGDLADVVRQAVEGQRLAWPGRDIALTLPRTPVRLLLDTDRIEQVVANFLTNALKYSVEDQPVAVLVTATRQTARVAVRDHGPGLSPEMQTSIWEPFHQVEGIRQQSGSGVGLGLGLHICRTLIERHGGRVGIDSVVGEGSTFWFELPLVPSIPVAPATSDATDAEDAPNAPATA